MIVFILVIPRGSPLTQWWSPPQVDFPEESGFSTLTWQSGSPARIELEPIYRGVHIVVREGVLQAGDTVTLIYGDTRQGSPGARVQRTAVRKVAFHVASDQDGDGKYRLLKALPTVTTVPGAPAALLVTAPSYARVGEPFTVRVAVLDLYKNAVDGFSGTLALRAQGLEAADLELPAEMTMTSEDRGIGTVTTTARQPGQVRIVARVETASVGDRVLTSDERQPLAATGNPTLVHQDPPPFLLLWGDIHGHTARSDGGGVPEDYYRYARDVVGLDFCALTDHDDMLDDAEWAESKRVTNSFNTPGRFTTMIGYEWTNWVHGHRNVYFQGDDAPIFRWTEPATNDPAGLWAALRGTGLSFMTIAHHPRGLSEMYNGGYAEIDWQRYHTDATMEPLVEVYSIQGHSENTKLAPPEYAGRHGFVQEALRQGLRLGLIAGGDDHSGHPGMGPGTNGEPAGLMAVYARANTRAAIWEAMQSRRVYGTTGARIIVDFHADGHWMGEEYTATTPPRFVARVWGTAPVARIELLRDTLPVHVVSGDSPFLTLDYTDEQPLAPTHLYYVRVWQKDGAMAWAGPIWVTYLGKILEP